VPQDREGRFSTELFERYQPSEKALVAAVAEMYVQGVSTRKVKAIAEELCGHSFSACPRAWLPAPDLGRRRGAARLRELRWLYDRRDLGEGRRDLQMILDTTATRRRPATDPQMSDGRGIPHLELYARSANRIC
jgi:transposase-like protein